MDHPSDTQGLPRYHGKPHQLLINMYFSVDVNIGWRTFSFFSVPMFLFSHVIGFLVASLSMAHTAPCGRPEPVPTFLKWPQCWRLQDVFWELRKLEYSRVLCWWQADRKVWGMRGVLGAWNEAWEAKSPNLGPGFFGRQQSVKFTEFLMLVVQLPFCPHHCVVRHQLGKGLESWNKRVEECRCDAMPAFVQKCHNADRWENC